MRRGFWFAAGAGAGVYAMTRLRHAAEAFTPEGLEDRVAGWARGLDLVRAEVREEMDRREPHLRARFGLDVPEPQRALSAARAPQPGEAPSLPGEHR